MSRVKIHYTLIHENDTREFETLGIFNQNKIHFKDQDTIFDIIIAENSILLKRKNKSYLLKIDFNLEDCKGIYNIDNIGEIKLTPIINKLVVEKEKIEIDYILNEENFKFKLQYEVIE